MYIYFIVTAALISLYGSSNHTYIGNQSNWRPHSSYYQSYGLPQHCTAVNLLYLHINDRVEDNFKKVKQ